MSKDESKYDWVKKIGTQPFASVEVQIGGTPIDKHYGQWLDVWNELDNNQHLDQEYEQYLNQEDEEENEDDEENDYKLKQYKSKECFECVICCDDIEIGDNICLLNCKHSFCYQCIDGWVKSGKNDCPMCRGQILKPPKLKKPYKQPNQDNLPNQKNNNLSVDYVYLDSEERRQFAQAGHGYLIEQLQFDDSVHPNDNKSKQNFSLNFNHPIKELMWTSNFNKFYK